MLLSDGQGLKPPPSLSLGYSLFTLTQPIILLCTVSLLYSFVWKVICCGSFPVVVRTALVFPFPKKPPMLR